MRVAYIQPSMMKVQPLRAMTGPRRPEAVTVEKVVIFGCFLDFFLSCKVGFSIIEFGILNECCLYEDLKLKGWDSRGR